jgi:mRNA-degrading endonuclease RelE of RelBE toxin-antitoxin system
MLKTKLFSKNKKHLLQLQLSLDKENRSQHGHFTMEDYRKWLKKGYVERVRRGTYRITEKGEKYMEII